MLSDREITLLCKDIQSKARDYYNGSPSISDFDFDKLTDKLYKEDPKNPIFSSLNWGYKVENTGQVKHNIQVGNLDSINDIIQLTNYLEETNDKFILTPKYIGHSVVISYDMVGAYRSAVTVGNGITGIDISEKIRNFVPKQVGISRLVVIADILTKKCYNVDEFYIDEFIADKNDGSDFKNIELITHTWLNSSIDKKLVREGKLDKVKSLQMLKLMGFSVTPFKLIDNFNINYIDHEYLRESFEYATNGLVLTANTPILSNNLRWNEKVFLLEKVRSSGIVQKIEWTNQRNKYIPTVTVEVKNGKKEKIELCNFNYLAQNKIGIGSSVEIVKINSRFPYISKVISETDDLKNPTKCFFCGNTLSKAQLDLVCSNPYCPALLKSMIYTWLTWLGEKNKISNITKPIISQFLEVTNIGSLIDLFNSISMIKKDVDYYSEPIRNLFKSDYKHLSLSEAIMALTLNIGLSGVGVTKLVGYLEYLENYKEPLWINNIIFDEGQVAILKTYWPLIVGVTLYTKTKFLDETLDSLREVYGIIK